jgi:hypothetical protein
MTRSPDPVRELIQEWAAEESEHQPMRFTPAMLRAKHLLAREDRRRTWAGRIQLLIVALPIVLLGAALRPSASLGVFADRLLGSAPSTLAAVLGVMCVVAYVGSLWVSE